MDWADDVTYAVHDAEDFYRAGLIPLDRLSLRDDSERRRFFDGIESRQDLLSAIGGKLTSDYKEAFYKVVIGFPLDQEYKGTADQRSALRFFFSALIGEYIDALGIVVLPPVQQTDDTSGAQHAITRLVDIDVQRERQVKMLKLLTWHYVIYNPSLAMQQYGQRKMIRELFEIFYKAATNPREELEILPFAARDSLESGENDPQRLPRLVADLICNMTERQVVETHQRLSGVALGSILHRPI
jgi:dGTPase